AQRLRLLRAGAWPFGRHHRLCHLRHLRPGGRIRRRGGDRPAQGLGRRAGFYAGAYGDRIARNVREVREGEGVATPSWFDRLTMRATEIAREGLTVSLSNHEV